MANSRHKSSNHKLQAAKAMNINESMLIDSKSARDSQLADFSDERTLEILVKAKGIIHFAQVGSEKLATIDQMAEFYEVPEETIKTCLKRNKREFEADGLTVLKGRAQLSGLREARVNMNLPGIPLRVTVLTTLSPRAGVRLGMLLRDSLVAHAVRDGVLDLVEESVQPEPVEEQDLLLNQLKAMVAIRERQQEQDQLLKRQQEQIMANQKLLESQEQRLKGMESVQANAHKELVSLPPATHEVPPETMDMKVRRIVNTYCVATSLQQAEVYRSLYQQFYHRYRRTIKPNKGESKLQAFVRLGLADALYDLALELFAAKDEVA